MEFLNLTPHWDGRLGRHKRAWSDGVWESHKEDVPSVLIRMILSQATSGTASSGQSVCDAGEGFGAPAIHQE